MREKNKKSGPVYFPMELPISPLKESPGLGNIFVVLATHQLGMPKGWPDLCSRNLLAIGGSLEYNENEVRC